tara:strand:- start:942 stop:1199 length:258 start_codon:yes stop_codon:yes gene_type:complete
MITLKEHHIQKAVELNALQCAEMNEGRDEDMNTTELINYHTKRAVELRAQEIVETRDREEPKAYYFVAGLVVGSVIGGAVVALLL